MIPYFVGGRDTANFKKGILVLKFLGKRPLEMSRRLDDNIKMVIIVI